MEFFLTGRQTWFVNFQQYKKYVNFYRLVQCQQYKLIKINTKTDTRVLLGTIFKREFFNKGL